MKSRILIAFLLFSCTANTKPSDQGLPSNQVADLFAVEDSPGRGSLVYTVGGVGEKITFGAVAGRYGLGMIFDTSSLPEPLRAQFGDRGVIQIVLGTFQKKLKGEVAQFGALTLITKKPPTNSQSFRFVIPTVKDGKIGDLAFLLFSSPSTLANLSDQEKLKSNFFAKSGFLNVSPSGEAVGVTVSSGAKHYSFKKRTLKLGFNASLVSPFGPQINQLKGTIEFPVYWPADRQALELLTAIAAESLSGAPSAVRSLTSPQKEVAGSGAKNPVEK